MVARRSAGPNTIRDSRAGRMSVIVVLDHPQDLVNIAHVVRGLKNFGLRDLRLVNPREYESYRVAGLAHQTQDILSRWRVYATLAEAIAERVHVVCLAAPCPT